MTSPWQILGVGPDADARTIRSAYARKLKSTRPDDDAIAYQRLREAYDFALEQARLVEERSLAVAAAPESSLEPVGPAADVATTADTSAGESPPTGETQIESSGPTDDADEAAVQPPDAEQLARSLHQYWLERGDGGLLEAWPSLLAHLDALPLSERPSANLWFAEFVLQAPQLPPAFVLKLADYFEWGRDYRSESVLGPERSERIGYRLSAARRDEIRAGAAPEVAPLVRLVELMRSRGRWFVLALLALLKPDMRRAFDEHRQPMIHLFARMTEDEDRTLSRLFDIALLLRCAFVVGLISLAGTLDHSSDSASHYLGMLGVAALVFLIAAPCRYAIRAQFRWLAARLPARIARFAPWRESIAVGVAVVLALAMWLQGPLPHPVVGADERDWPQGLMLIVGVWAALLLAWPEDETGDRLVLPVFMLLSLIVGDNSYATIGVATGVAVSLGWVGASAYLMAHHRERAASVCFGSRAFKWPRGWPPALRSVLLLLGLGLVLAFWKVVLFAVAVVLVILMPFNYFLMEQVHSRLFAAAAMVSGLVWSPILFDVKEMPVFGVLNSLAISLAALFVLQRMGDALAGRMIARFGDSH